MKVSTVASSSEATPDSVISGAQLGGQELLQMIIGMTGLPHDLVRSEIDVLIQKSGFDANSLTMDQFRLIMQLYLERVASSMNL